MDCRARQAYFQKERRGTYRRYTKAERYAKEERLEMLRRGQEPPPWEEMVAEAARSLTDMGEYPG